MIRGCLAGALLLLSSLPAATPVEYRQKVGVYVWGKLGKDLDTAAGAVKRLGADRVGFVITAADTREQALAAAEQALRTIKVTTVDAHH